MDGSLTLDAETQFLSTPSGWRATAARNDSAPEIAISIHALRVEGDDFDTRFLNRSGISIHALRVEGDENGQVLLNNWDISIHALRVEGDQSLLKSISNRTISIHALRVEGDHALSVFGLLSAEDFYPRPPGGGRRIVGRGS